MDLKEIFLMQTELIGEYLDLQNGEAEAWFGLNTAQYWPKILKLLNTVARVIALLWSPLKYWLTWDDDGSSIENHFHLQKVQNYIWNPLEHDYLMCTIS